MGDVTYEDVGVSKGDQIKFSENETYIVSGKGELDGQICFERGISLAPYIVQDALDDGEMEIL